MTFSLKKPSADIVISERSGGSFHWNNSLILGNWYEFYQQKNFYWYKPCPYTRRFCQDSFISKPLLWFLWGDGLLPENFCRGGNRVLSHPQHSLYARQERVGVSRSSFSFREGILHCPPADKIHCPCTFLDEEGARHRNWLGIPMAFPLLKFNMKTFSSGRTVYL